MAPNDVPIIKMSRNDQLRRWQRIREMPENEKCAECHALDTSWAVLDYGMPAPLLWQARLR